MECKCKWNDKDEVTEFCGAHYQAHRKILDPIEHKLTIIEDYAAKQHPLVSSKACPLCTWVWDTDPKFPGWAQGKRIKDCSYHHALNQLYTIKQKMYKADWAKIIFSFDGWIHNSTWIVDGISW